MPSNGVQDLVWLVSGGGTGGAQDYSKRKRSPLEADARREVGSSQGTSHIDSERGTTTRMVFPSEDSIVSHLTARLRRQLPFTRIGNRTLVAVNAHRVLAHYGDSSREDYARHFTDDSFTGYEDEAGSSSTSEPHIYGMAAHVYMTMRRSDDAQAVLFHGVSGSGKTYMARLFTDQIVDMSTRGRSKRKIEQQLRAVEIVLQSFGHAKSAQHSNASRLGRFTELHFDAEGGLTQAKIIAFLMDKRRVVRVPRGQRTFHVFYQLLAGASTNDKEALKLKEVGHYKLLEQSGCTCLSPSQLGSEAHLADDAASFSDLLNAFKTLNLKAKHLGPVYGILVAILELGNITFNDNGDECAKVDVGESKEAVEHAAELLGIQAEDLEGALTHKTRYIQKELCTVLLDAAGAASQRDSLSSGLYSILVQFIIELINSRISLPSPSFEQYQDQNRLIAVLDLPGHQNRNANAAATYASPFATQMSNVLGYNGPDEFAINFAAEASWAWTCRRNFDSNVSHRRLMVHDGLGATDVKVEDNARCLELLRGNALLAEPSDAVSPELIIENASAIFNKRDKKPGGLLGCIEQSFQYRCNGESSSVSESVSSRLYASMKAACGNHRSISFPDGSTATKDTTLLGSLANQGTFTISHYNGPSTYDSAEFLDGVADSIDPDFVTLLRAGEEPLITRIFEGSAIAGKSHPLDRNTLVSAQVNNLPLRSPTPIQLPSFARGILDPAKMHAETTALNAILAEIFGLTLGRCGVKGVNSIWNVLCIRPNDLAAETNQHNQMPIIDQKTFRSQIQSFLIADSIALIASDTGCRDYCVSFTLKEFCQTYRHLDHFSSLDEVADINVNRGAIERLVEAMGWLKGDFLIGHSRVWLSERSWLLLEKDRPITRTKEERHTTVAEGSVTSGGNEDIEPFEEHAHSSDDLQGSDHDGLVPLSRNVAEGLQSGIGTHRSTDDLLLRREDSHNPETILLDPNTPGAGEYGAEANSAYFEDSVDVWESISQVNGRADIKTPGLEARDAELERKLGLPVLKAADVDLKKDYPSEKGNNGLPPGPGGSSRVQIEPLTASRKWWVLIVWACTWWIPTFLIRWIGRMKRPDVIMAWREKVTLCLIITFICGVILFYIIAFGKILCPNYDKAWNAAQLATHQGTNDFYVAVRGNVYDLTKFYKVQHSDVPGITVTTANMLPYAGLDITQAFPIPTTQACPGLVTSDAIVLVSVNQTISDPTVIHYSGGNPKLPANYKNSALANEDWYFSTFLPKMMTMQKGAYVFAKDDVSSNANSEQTYQVIIHDRVYDFSDYIYAQQYYAISNPAYAFLDSSLEDLVRENNGQDITSDWDDLSYPNKMADLNCINNLLYIGQTDYRQTARCQVQNYILLAFSVILVSVILVKFVSALQLTPKRNPEPQNKFVICQVPCYTEDHDSLKNCVDSLATLEYDDKAKLLMFICDGMIVGSGNDKPTPRIILDILGVDPSLDPPPLVMRSVGEGSRQLNYGKIYSGLYEVDGHVVPYLVVVKVGKPSERSKPGNRGKRDSQVLLLRFLNKVHFNGKMNPLELEMYYQMKNIIGVDPAFYEYILMVDADTTVHMESLNRLVARTSEDSKIVGICGETSLANEDITWWTMIQVYEYYISHHLAKAFESLFGSVTCLPGCFCMYRIRSVEEDGSRPLIISEKILDEYSECNVDTLHKKNLLALGEDRYLTTLVMKHLYRFKNTFASDAKATTAAPDKWSILLSQRRRWINSTVHNLWELVALPEHCGFLCFSMRFVVLIDMIGTVILPATVVYLIYLIVVAATGASAFPLISIIMIGAVYGLQMIILLLKRQWQHIGWLFVYLLAYPIYGFILPIYSFWNFDDFSWGSTRVVGGEKGTKKIILASDDTVFDEASIPLKTWQDYERERIADPSFADNQDEEGERGQHRVVDDGPALSNFSRPQSQRSVQRFASPNKRDRGLFSGPGEFEMSTSPRGTTPASAAYPRPGYPVLGHGIGQVGNSPSQISTLETRPLPGAQFHSYTSLPQHGRYSSMDTNPYMASWMNAMTPNPSHPQWTRAGTPSGFAEMSFSQQPFHGTLPFSYGATSPPISRHFSGIAQPSHAPAWRPDAADGYDST